jgi:hypothetical protein
MPIYVGDQHITAVYVGDKPASVYQGDNLMLAAGTAPPDVPQATNFVYQGARIDGPYYGASYPYTRPQVYNSSTPTSDSPFDIPANLDVTNTTTGLFEQHQGKKVTAVHYGGSGSAWPPAAYDTGRADRLRARGCFPYYGWGTSQTGMNELAGTTGTAASGQPTGQGAPRGNAVSYLTTFFTVVKNHGHPMLYRPLWEMNGTWYTWGRPSFDAAGTFVRGLTDAQFIQAWRNLWQICADVMSGTGTYGTGTHTGNVAWHWAPNNFNPSGNYGVSPQPRWPGSAYVDWTGWQGYLFKDYGNTYTPEYLYGPSYNLSQSLKPGSPVAIGEYGAMTTVNYTGGKAKWFDDLFTWLEARPLIKCIMYYNEYEPGSDYETVHIEMPEEARQVWASRIANTRYLANIVSPTDFPSGQKLPVP